MKKLTVPALLCLAFSLCLCLNSCLELSGGETHEILPSATDTATATPTAQEETPTATATAAPTEAEQELSIEPTTCFSWNGLTVTAKSIEIDSFWKTPEIKLLIENDSDKTYTVGCRTLLVNNYSISDLFSCEVAAGKKANDTLTLSSSDLEDAGITRVGQIEIYFYVYDSETWDTVYEAPVVVLQTSLYEQMDSNGMTGYLLYDKNGIQIYAQAIRQDILDGSTLYFCMANTSGETVSVHADDISVNGFMVSAYMGATIYPGKYAVDTLYLSASDLEENDITAVETVELSFRIYGEDSLFPIEETEPVSFNVK